jgi:hypothetical protein
VPASPSVRCLAGVASGALLLLAFARPACASDVDVTAAGGLTGYASTWRGDFGTGGTIRAGVRFAHILQPDLQLWESFATVNERMNTELSLGISAFLPLPGVHPYVRLYALHQHEEGLVSVENTPAGFLFGIGAGIRHRAGAGAQLGIELPLRISPSGRLATLLFAELKANYFPDSTLGPTSYVGIDVGVGLDYLLQ